MDLGKCTMTCIHHYCVILSIFTALKILCALPTHLSSKLPTPGQLLIFVLSLVLPFPECYIVGTIQPFQIGFLEICISVSSFYFHDLTVHFFLVLNSVPLSACSPVYLSIHLLKDVLVASSFGSYE